MDGVVAKTPPRAVTWPGAERRAVTAKDGSPGSDGAGVHLCRPTPQLNVTASMFKRYLYSFRKQLTRFPHYNASGGYFPSWKRSYPVTDYVTAHLAKKKKKPVKPGRHHIQFNSCLPHDDEFSSLKLSKEESILGRNTL